MKRTTAKRSGPEKSAVAPPPPPRLANLVSWKLGLVAFALALACYGPALRGTFLWDDDGHLTRMDLRSLAGLARIWFEIGATQQYYPVLHSAFWLEHFLFANSPTGYHVVNVLLHATSACLFAALLRRLGVRGAWLAGFLFLLHPVAVESVAWISEQKNTLSTVWYLLAALAYLSFDRTRRPRHYAFATLLFLLALGTKTVTATLPAALLVMFWWQRGRLDLRRDIVPLAPWFLFSFAAGLLTAWVEHEVVGAGHNDFSLDLVQRGLLASRAIWFYLGKLIYPVDLIFVYPRWEIDAGVWWQYLFPLGIVLLALAAWRWRQHRGPIAAGLLFAGSLFPALGFVNVYPFVFSFVADHFQYLASLGIFAFAGASLTHVATRWRPLPAQSAAIGLLGLLGVLTWRQSATYRDPIALYQSTLAKNPDAWMAQNNLGNALVKAGRTEEGIAHLESAVRLRPDSAEAENNLGSALLGRGNPTAAIPHFLRAQQVRRDYVYAYNNLGLALLQLDRATEAETQFRAALKLKPEYPEAHLNLGIALAQLERTAEALTHLAAAARLRPNYLEAEYAWGIGLALSGHSREGLGHLERAVRLAPDRADIQFAFGRALALERRFGEAIDRYRAALKLAPGFLEAHSYLAEALQAIGQPSEAAIHLAEAARLSGEK